MSWPSRKMAVVAESLKLIQRDRSSYRQGYPIIFIFSRTLDLRLGLIGSLNALKPHALPLIRLVLLLPGV